VAVQQVLDRWNGKAVETRAVVNRHLIAA